MDQKEYMVGGLFWGLLMYSMIKDKTRDIRKNQRDLVAVLGDGIVHAVCTFAVIYVLSFRLMIIVYIFEVFSVAVAVVRYFKQQKGQNLKKKRSLKDFIFSGNVSAICTEENYALVKSWLPESVRMPKVKF